MASGAKLGKKTLFQREQPVGSGSYVTLAEMKQWSGPSLTRDVVDATSFDTADDYEEQIPGLKNGGEVSATLNFRPEHTSQGAASGLLKSFEDGTIETWRVQWPQFSGTPQMTFPGFLIAHEVTGATKELLSVQIKIKVTGKPTATNFA
jgi:predicted secreted protein